MEKLGGAEILGTTWNIPDDINKLIDKSEISEWNIKRLYQLVLWNCWKRLLMEHIIDHYNM